MGGRFSKVSCSCAINCNPRGLVHDHDLEVGHCPRCTRLRRSAESRASSASTSTEYLPRPRYYDSPSPERIHSSGSNASLIYARAVQQLDPRMRPHNRYIGVFDDPDTPSFVSDTPEPSRSPSVAESPRVRSRAHLARAIARLEVTEAAANNLNAANSNQTENEEEDNVPTPSNMSQSSTVVCHGSDAGSRPVSPSGVGGGSDPEHGSASERLDGQEERARLRENNGGRGRDSGRT